MLEFKPPKPDPALISLCKLLLPVYLATKDRISIEIHNSDSELINKLRNKRVVIAANHPDRQDPLAIASLVKFLGENAYTVTAREIFDWNLGARGWLFQRLGCYSVVREKADLQSTQMTMKILLGKPSKLIVFPESEVTADNQHVHDLCDGILHIILKAQDQLAARRNIEPIWILPVSIQYDVVSPLEPCLTKVLKKLEKRLKITPVPKADSTSRIDEIVRVLVETLSHEHNLPLPLKCRGGMYAAQFSTQSEQIESIAIGICNAIAAYLRTSVENPDTPEQLLHVVRNALGARLDETSRESKYQRSEAKGSQAMYRRFIDDLDRAERLLILSRTLAQPSSPIRTCRIVDYLEAEVVGHISAKGWQKATLTTGEPLSALHYLPVFRISTQAAIHLFASRLRSELQRNLDAA